MTEIHFLTAAEIGRLYRAGKLSPVELTKRYLDRIEAFDHALVSYVLVTRERALADARRAESELMRGVDRGPMHGIPYCLKDIVETAGIRTTGQSRSLADHVPTADAAVEAKLRAGGGVLLGKTTTWEFAHGGPSWDVFAPPAHNPWNTDNHPAGSSSGSAAAVAAGLAAVTIGTDTGGSIRQPAAACGIAGLKPTYGRVSRRGVLPNCFSHDYAGPLAWTTEDAALMLQVIAGHDALDPGSAEVLVPDYASALTGPMHGIPFGAKDIYDTAGILTSCQSKLRAGAIPDTNAHSVQKLLDGGAVLLGKTATIEFATGGPTDETLFPPARNPWSLEHVPGGSSSGSAAVVAAGVARMALGSDTGGSIRGPAALCGTVGIKPTYERVSRRDR